MEMMAPLLSEQHIATKGAYDFGFDVEMMPISLDYQECIKLVTTHSGDSVQLKPW